MTAEFSLDANALTALAVTDHQHHQQVSRWPATSRSIPVCPVVDGALLGYLLRFAAGSATGVELLKRMYRDEHSDIRPGSIPS